MSKAAPAAAPAPLPSSAATPASGATKPAPGAKVPEPQLAGVASGAVSKVEQSAGGLAKTLSAPSDGGPSSGPPDDPPPNLGDTVSKVVGTVDTEARTVTSTLGGAVGGAPAPPNPSVEPARLVPQLLTDSGPAQELGDALTELVPPPGGGGGPSSTPGGNGLLSGAIDAVERLVPPLLAAPDLPLSPAGSAIGSAPAPEALERAISRAGTNAPGPGGTSGGPPVGTPAPTAGPPAVSAGGPTPAFPRLPAPPAGAPAGRFAANAGNAASYASGAQDGSALSSGTLISSRPYHPGARSTDPERPAGSIPRMPPSPEAPLLPALAVGFASSSLFFGSLAALAVLLAGLATRFGSARRIRFVGGRPGGFALLLERPG